MRNRDTWGVPNMASGYMTAFADTSTDTAGLWSTQVNDPADQAALQPWVEMRCYQLSDGEPVAQMDCLDLGAHKVVRERQDAGIQKLGRSPADFCTISACTQGAEVQFSELSSGLVDTTFFLPGNTEFDIQVPAGIETIYISFSQEQFMRGARALDPEAWDSPPERVTMLHTPRKSALKDVADLWFKAARDAQSRGEILDPDVMRRIVFQAALQIATARPEDNVNTGPSFSECSRASQIGRTARGFVEDRLDRDVLPTVVDICVSLGVSERTLQYAIREYVGVSPSAYLRQCRLNRVHWALASSGPQNTTVTQAATRFGFLHLSRFAGDYQRMFGETPSVTLAS